MNRQVIPAQLLLNLLICGDVWSQDRPRGLPKEDAIDVAAVGEGLCVHNAFQTNMVLQRDEPIHVWGWAPPGKMVTVSFADARKSAAAEQNRAWKVTLPAMQANSVPETMTVKGNDKRLVLTNILIGDVWILAPNGILASFSSV